MIRISASSSRRNVFLEHCQQITGIEFIGITVLDDSEKVPDIE